LDIYYPEEKNDPKVRKEMKKVLIRFNSIYYNAYTGLIKDDLNLIFDSHPRKHSKQHAVQDAVKYCKLHKTMRKNLVKVEDHLNLQFIIENQMEMYDKEIQKVRATIELIEHEDFSSYFSDLYEVRMEVLGKIEAHCLNRLTNLEEEKNNCEKLIFNLIHKNLDLWGSTGRFIEELIYESETHVSTIIERSFKDKS